MAGLDVRRVKTWGCSWVGHGPFVWMEGVRMSMEERVVGREGKTMTCNGMMMSRTADYVVTFADLGHGRIGCFCCTCSQVSFGSLACDRS